MTYGYVRVSTKGQQRDGNSLQDQEKLIKSKYPEALIISEAFSGAKERPKFLKLLDDLQPGDTLVVTKLDRFCRTARDGLDYIHQLEVKDVTIHVLNMAMFDTTPQGKLMKTILLGFAEFERDMILERTSAGKEIAKQRPGFKEGRPKKISDTEFQKILKKQKDGEISVSEAISHLQISRTTWYNRVNSI